MFQLVSSCGEDLEREAAGRAFKPSNPHHQMNIHQPARLTPRQKPFSSCVLGYGCALLPLTLRSAPFIQLLLGCAALCADGATFTVTTTNDSGPGSLRDAIVAANATPEADVIVFDPAGPPPRVIALSSALPALTGILSILNDRPGDQPITVQRSAASGTPEFRIFEVRDLTPDGGINPVTLVLSGLTISNGLEEYWGAGIFADSSNVTIRRCTITGNFTRGSGGGISNFDSTLDIIDSSISNNIARSSGGGIDVEGGIRTTLINCSVSDNVTTQAGGGIYNTDFIAVNSPGELRLKNCTFSGNSARYGGGIYNVVDNRALVSITNCTISGNTSELYAGGIYSYWSTAEGGFYLANSIISGNTTGYIYNGHDMWARCTSLGHNFLGRENPPIPGVTSSTGLINGVNGDQVGTSSAPINPLLGPLQMNGGSTATRALLAGSSAINAGDDSFASLRDQRGYARSGNSDIGAFEFGGTYPRPLQNISTRARVETDDNVLIAGFIILGTESKRVMIRALGPSLEVPNRLVNPRLELRNSTGQVISANDDWRQAANRQEIIGSSLAPTNDAESAILTMLAPGAYTAIIRGVADTTGIGLAEVYDLGAGSEATLANISTRGLVRSGDDVMIGGFISSPTSTRVAIRAIGPSLGALGVPNSLPNPYLELHDSNGAITATNDNWQDDPAQVQELIDLGLAPQNPLESAVIATIPIGGHTAIVRDVAGAHGVGLVEIYQLE